MLTNETKILAAAERIRGALRDRAGLGGRPVARELLWSALFWLESAAEYARGCQVDRADYCIRCATHFLAKI